MFLLFALLSIVACKDDDEDANDPFTAENLQGTWNVTGSDADITFGAAGSTATITFRVTNSTADITFSANNTWAVTGMYTVVNNELGIMTTDTDVDATGSGTWSIVDGDLVIAGSTSDLMYDGTYDVVSFKTDGNSVFNSNQEIPDVGLGLGSATAKYTFTLAK